MGDDRTFEGAIVWDGGSAKMLDTELDSGNEGAIHAIRGTGDAVAKVFWSDKRGEKKDKVRAMLQNEPTDPTLEEKGFPSIIWPTAMLYESRSGPFIGYQMPRLDTTDYTPAQTYARDQLQWDESSETDRYRPGANLAIVVDTVHQQNHAIGDMNHENILVNDGYIALVDCDSFHITGRNAEYPDSTTFPRYLPVEGRGRHLQIVQRADRFGLAVHIFQFLMQGWHPYAAVGSKSTGGSVTKMIRHNRFPYDDPDPDVLEPPGGAPPYEKLPGTVRELFKQCFVYGKKQTGARPTARDWAQTLLAESDLENDISGDIGPDTSTAKQRWGDSDTDAGDDPDTGPSTRPGSRRRRTSDWRAQATNGSVTSSRDTLGRVVSTSDEICGAETSTTDDPCQLPATKLDGRCWLHTDADQPIQEVSNHVHKRTNYLRTLKSLVTYIILIALIYSAYRLFMF